MINSHQTMASQQTRKKESQRYCAELIWVQCVYLYSSRVEDHAGKVFELAPHVQRTPFSVLSIPITTLPTHMYN